MSVESHLRLCATVASSSRPIKGARLRRLMRRLSLLCAIAAGITVGQMAQAVTVWNGSATNTGTPNNAGLAGQYYNQATLNPVNVGSANSNYSPVGGAYQEFQWLLNRIPVTLAAPNAGLTEAYTNVNFANAGFGAAAPFASVGLATTDNINARWVGTINILPTDAGNITFFTNSDDGSVLYIDGQSVVNNNFFQGNTERNGIINLSAGLHEIVVGFYEGGGGAGVQANYDPAGAQPKQIIPVIRGADQILQGSQKTLALADPIVDLQASTVVTSTHTLNVTATNLNVRTSLSPNITLTNQGTTLQFANTTFDAAGSLTLTSQNSLISDYRLGRINDGGFNVQINKQSENTVILDHTSSASVTGNTTFNIQAGTLAVISSGAAGNFNPLGNGVVNLSGGEIMLASISGTAVINNTISGSGNVQIGFNGVNTGVVSRTTAMNHTGTTRINDGVLLLGTGGSLSNTSGITVGNTAGTDILRVTTTANGDNINLGLAGITDLTLSTAGNNGTLEAQRGVINVGRDIVDGGGTSRINMFGGPAGSSVTINANGGAGSITVDNIDWDYGAINAANLTVNTELQIRNVTVTSNAITLGGLFQFDAGGNGTGIVGDSPTDTLNLNNGVRELRINNGTAVIDTTINSIISNGSINKTNAGTLLLNNANTYAGSTQVTAGILQIADGAALGSAIVGTSVSSGATLQMIGNYATNEALQLSGAGLGGIGALNTSGNVTINGAVSIIDNTSITSALAGTVLTLNGPVTRTTAADITFAGAGDIVVNSGIADALFPVTFSNMTGRLFLATGLGINNPTGATNINTVSFTGVPANSAALAGGLTFANDAAFTTFFGGVNPNAANFTAAYVGDLTIGANGTYYFAASNNDDGAAVWIDTNQDGDFDAGELLQGLVANNNTAVASRTLAAGVYKIVYAVQDTGGGSALTGRFEVPQVFAPTNATAMRTVNPAAVFPTSNDLIKNGTGSLKITGAINSTNDIIVNGGLLDVTSAPSVVASLLVVNNTATLAALNLNVADVTVNTGGTLAPGGAGVVGTMAITGNLNFGNGAFYNWDYSLLGNDLITVGGDLNFLGAGANLVINSVGGSPLVGNSSYVLFTYDGVLLSSLPSWNVSFTNGTTVFNTAVVHDAANQRILLQVIVPEPATMSLLLMGGIGLLGRRRNRHA